MPNELLYSLPATILVGGVSIENGRLNYGERFVQGAKPAIITFDSMHVMVDGIATHRDDAPPIVIRGEWIFMREAPFHMLMSIPVGSPEFSYRCSGSLGRMDLSALNSFIEIAEQQRIKTGVLQSAAFDINVTAGHASGSVRANYRDLLLAAINKKTGSEKGFVDGLTSFIARTFKIRRNNVPDKSGAMKVGLVKQTRKRSEVFFEFTWFALRSGVGDVVGF